MCSGSLRKDRDVDVPAVVVTYDPGWPGLFRELHDRVDSALAGVAHVTEHVGSTAVPGQATRYADLKHRLAGLLAADRLAYSDGKAEMIAEFLRQARCGRST
jgi:GrpB-like predicted nucleotidyltransferase (UPF0157 family)